MSRNLEDHFIGKPKKIRVVLNRLISGTERIGVTSTSVVQSAIFH